MREKLELILLRKGDLGTMKAGPILLQVVYVICQWYSESQRDMKRDGKYRTSAFTKLAIREANIMKLLKLGPKYSQSRGK